MQTSLSLSLNESNSGGTFRKIWHFNSTTIFSLSNGHKKLVLSKWRSPRPVPSRPKIGENKNAWLPCGHHLAKLIGFLGETHCEQHDPYNLAEIAHSGATRRWMHRLCFLWGGGHILVQNPWQQMLDLACGHTRSLSHGFLFLIACWGVQRASSTPKIDKHWPVSMSCGVRMLWITCDGKKTYGIPAWVYKRADKHI